MSYQVLIAEDEFLLRSFYKRILETAGHQVIEAVDGLQAVEKFQEHKDGLSLVLLDMTMPGLEGSEVLREIRQTDSRLPVIIASGFGEDAFAEADYNAFLKKPFNGERLLTTVQAVCPGGASPES